MEKVYNKVRGFLSLLFWVIIFIIPLRFFEFIVLWCQNGDGLTALKMNALGIIFDLVLIFRFSLFLGILYWILSYFGERFVRIFFRCVISIFMLINASLVIYFISAGLPLDRAFFDYSLSEIFFIVSASKPLSWWIYVVFLIQPIFFFIVSRKDFLFIKKWHFFVVLGLILVSFFVNKAPSTFYSSMFEKNIISNKLHYFTKSVMHGSFMKISDKEEYNELLVDRFQANFPEDKFLSKKFPFAHENNGYDPLSSLISLDNAEKPNVVFIIVEGLGRDISGESSLFPSATPFLDSLSRHSLVWNNCLSTSQRTFMALPSILGALPFDQRGFMEASSNPDFQTIYTFLRKNGYDVSFFYGGWMGFDNMSYFIRDNGISNIIKEGDYPAEMKNTWGLFDEYTFSEGMKKIDFQSDKPHFDIFLTLTTHDPFDYPNKEKYVKIYREKCKNFNIPDWKLEATASYLYFDHCLSDFFKKYKQTGDFENTIFVITGDHHFDGTADELNKYHVPMVIYSPKLKENKSFHAVVSHRDISPSFVNLLKNKYNLSSFDTVEWLNKGLDTASFFRSTTFSPMMRTSHDLKDFLFHDIIFMEDEAYSLSFKNRKLALESVDNQHIMEMIQDYLVVDNYVMNNDALIPNNEEKYLISEVTALDSVAVQGDEYRDLLRLNLPSDVKKISIIADFDIFLPEDNDYYNVVYTVALKNLFDDVVVTSNNIHHKEYEYSEQWHSVHFVQKIDVEKGQFSDYDKLLLYLWNAQNKDFSIKNLRVSVFSLK